MPTFSLPRLPYDSAALEPVIGAETMRIHHGKHHARYVVNTNSLLSGRSDAPSLEDVILEAERRGDTPLFNNAAQAWNHGFFWQCMAPAATAATSGPHGGLIRAIETSFGGPAALREEFVTKGAGHFGSGWVWLLASGHKLEVVAAHDAAQPWLGSAAVPVLVCDVWEHAYYLDYKNERERFLCAWFDGLVNWRFALEQFAAAARNERGWRYPTS